MGNAWFRFYYEWDEDPKVQMMPEAMQRRLAMLFCWRCRGETFHVTRAAFRWRLTEEQMEETRLLFLRQGFIDEKWNLINWDRRQFLSDSSTDRVRRFRAKKANETDETKCNAEGTVSSNGKSIVDTPSETVRNVTVTGSSVSVSVSDSVFDSDAGSELALANWLFEEVGIVGGNAERRIAAEAIRLLAKEGGTRQTAAEYIREAAIAAKADGEVIDRFWFTSQKYRPESERNRGKRVRKSQTELAAEQYLAKHANDPD